jgi:branched-chain amino acid transport system permease protein
MLGVMVTGPEATAEARYLVALGLVVVFGVIAKNLVRGRVGRSWMAIRDRDIAAEIIGVRPLRTKLLAFAISSFYCGVAGAMLVFLFLGSAETLAFDINQSFLVLFMVIIGGLGSILGSFLGAAFIILTPIFLTNAPHWLGLSLSVALQKEIELMVFGGLILFFLIAEPHGLARLWQVGKEKLRLWPFPH